MAISTGRVDAMRAWLTANAIHPKDVLLDSDMTIEDSPDGRVLRIQVADLDDFGRKQIDEHGQNVATKFVTVPLKVEPPEWWEPYQKPTRDQLLAVLREFRMLGVALEYEATGIGLAEPARETLRDAGRRIRDILEKLPAPAES